ncbi:MAG: helix-turn-helix transcriptional regulator [Clostridia bacterium]|nr:helix-turn-helix transcriptional regulator [Clostridia bacterium]
MLYNEDDLCFNILSVGNYVHRNGEIFVHARPYAALSLRLCGSGLFTVDGEECLSSPGDVMFIPAGLAYRVIYTDSESLVVHLTACDYDRAEFYSGCFGMLPLFEAVREHWQQNAVNRVKAGVYEILARLEEASAPHVDPAVLACKAHLDRCYTDAFLRLSDVCREGGISQPVFRRRFHMYYGSSPMQYLTKLRMQRAATLLSTGRYGVKAVAPLCGFSDEKYFSRAFHAYYGESPSAFCKRIKM